MRKGVSPLISAVILIAIVFAIGTIVSPWLNTLTRDVTNQTSSATLHQLTCRNAAYDFDTSYETNGIRHNVTNVSDTLQAKIVNTGTVNLHTFSFEVEITQLGKEREILQLELNDSTKRTEAMPLKPGQSFIIKANLSGDINGTLHEVKILNGVCPEKFIRQSI